MRPNKKWTAALVVIALVGILSISFRGSLSQTSLLDAYAYNQKNLAPISSLTPVFEERPSFNLSLQTSLGFTNVSKGNNQISGDLTGSGGLGYFILSTPLNFSILEYPLIALSFSTSPPYGPDSGFAFGVRFVTNLPNGTSIVLENDTWTNEHIPSGGTSEVSVYLPNYSPTYENITAIQVYGEQRAGVSSAVQLRINSVELGTYKETSCIRVAVCLMQVPLPNADGYFDSLATDVNATGTGLVYTLEFFHERVAFQSSTYGAGEHHIAFLSSAEGSVPSYVPLKENMLVVSATEGNFSSFQIQTLDLTFTSSPTFVSGTLVSHPVVDLTFAGELSLVFMIPIISALMLARTTRWYMILGIGIVCYVLLIPWTGHSIDTVLWIRAAYLFYHVGWLPSFYNPPTYFAYALPIGMMSLYYVAGLQGVDQTALFHWGGVIATTFVKMPFLLADVACIFLIFRFNKDKRFGLLFLLNPFNIFVTAMWGQYEAFPLATLLLGYLMLREQSIRRRLGGVVSLVISGATELFGFIVLPFYILLASARKRFLEVIVIIATVAAVLIALPSLGSFLANFLSLGSGLLKQGIYSVPYNFGFSGYIPLLISIIGGLAVTAYFTVKRLDLWISSVAVTIVIISVEVFGNGHPQWMLVPIGLLTAYCASKNDLWGAVYMFIFGLIYTILFIISVQSVGYLLLGEGYAYFPAIEHGNGLPLFSLLSSFLYLFMLIRTIRRSSFTTFMLGLLSILVLVAYIWLQAI